MRVTNPNDLKALSKGLEGMTGDLEEEIKRLPAGVAMLVSNEIERPITVNVRPRKSRHGGVSTQIVIKEKAASSGSRASRSIDKRSGSPPVSPAGSKASRPREKKASGLLKKVFGARKA
jgi:DNA helicase HerA-like ATPase